MAALPARQPGLPAPRARGTPGAGRALTTTSRSWLPLLAVAAAAALLLAADADVHGPGALDEVVRASAAAIVLFGISGFALTRLLLPASLAPWWPLFVLPVGAAASGLALTVLGFAAVPFKVALALTLAAGALGCVAAVRRAPVRVQELDARRLTWLAAACALIVAVALIPTFRAGFATVTGTGSDAHQVVGAATFVQHNYPSSTDVAYPVDEVRAIWNSKYPIFYALAGVSTLSGLEPFEAMMTLTALLLAMTALGLFLVARRILGASAGVAAIAMGVAVLDREVFHLATHPYYNQSWGLFTLPFSLVLGHAWVEDRSRGALVLLALVTGLGAFAYPLMLPFPVLIVGGFWLLERRERRRRGERVEPLDPRRLWTGWSSALWLVPAAALLVLPIRGVVEKVRDALELVFDSDQSLADWGGDVFGYRPFPEFFALPDVPVAGAFGAAAVIALAAWATRPLPRRTVIPFAGTLGLALAVAGVFAILDGGQYFYFKILSFAGALIVTAAVVGLSRLPWRAVGPFAVAVLAATAVVGVREELEGTYDQLPRDTLELREWSKRLPEGASVRIDTPDQIWRAYMFSQRPVGSTRPVKSFPHPPFSLGGDYALTDTSQPPPPDAATREPLFENPSLRLWKVTSRYRGRSLPDTSSRRLVRVAFDRAVD